MKKIISLLLVMIMMLSINITAFATDEKFTRGSFCQKIVEILEIEYDVTDVSNPFTDINPDDKYYDAAVWMCQLGYIGPDYAGRFNPNEKMYNAHVAKVLTTMVFGNFSVPNFEEISEEYHNHWASMYLWKAVDSGLMVGIGNWNTDADANESSINFDLFKELMEKDLSSSVYYTEHYYLENADGNGYSVYEKDYFTSSLGNSVSATEKNYIGFTENTELGIHTGIVKKDNTLILSRYYDRNVYEVNLMINLETSLSLKGKYGVDIELPIPTYNGNIFGGWYRDSLYKNKVSVFEMPLNGTTLYANWIQLNTEMEYTINDIIVRDSETYNELSNIPNYSFIAEINITNLLSLDDDLIIIASYDANNRLKSVNYMYANIDIGKTSKIGTLINNFDGDIAEIKAFVWDSFTSLRPVAEYKNIKK